VNRILSKLLDILYPRVCPVCGGMSDRAGRHICWKCFSALPFNTVDKPHCVRCGKVPDGDVAADFLCDACRLETPAFDLARTALPFHSEARDLVHVLKYKKGMWIANDLADILEGCARAHFNVGDIDLILPVPLSPLKFRKREYNQSALLAKRLSKHLDIPCRPALLERVRDTPTQTHLTVSGRKNNVKGAFSVTDPPSVRARTILVVDDVMTTGATLGEIAATLKAAGAWRVWALAIARG
jgi:ComF family protein